ARWSSTAPAGLGPHSAYSGSSSRTSSQLTGTTILLLEHLPQTFSGPVQPDLHRALLDPDLLGDLPHGEPVHVLEEQDRSLPSGEGGRSRREVIALHGELLLPIARRL